MLQVAIVGGGPLGLSLALMLKQAGMASIVFDARAADADHDDARVLALSHGSRQMLERLGVWRHLDSTPIDTIHVSQQGHLGRTQMTARENGVAALGYVIPAGKLVAALAEACAAAGITIRRGIHVQSAQADGPCTRLSCLTTQGEERIETQLVAWADGAIRDDHDILRRDYHQQALVATVGVRNKSTGLAFERFTTEGIAALLPLGNAYHLIWTLPTRVAAERVALDAAPFLDLLAKAFAHRLDFVSLGARSGFPLGLRYRTSPVGERAVWLGNAAQTLHPVAGQGFNLALRDAAQLSRLLASHPQDCGQASLLAQHARMRRLDRTVTRGFSDTLVRLFGQHDPLSAHLRGAALLALDVVAPARRFLAQRMIYGLRV